MSEIIIYQTPDNQTQVEVQFEGETFWLSLNEIAVVFERDKSVISMHLKNIFHSGELQRNSVVAKNATTATDGKNYNVEYYNLDAILSVGYRVNSKRGTQFRQWATQRLKDFMTRGFILNEKRLTQLVQNMQQLEKAVSLIQNSSQTETLQLQQAKGLLDILSSYTKSFVLLNQYDSHNLPSASRSENITYEITYEEANAAIFQLKKQLISEKEATELS